MLIPLVPSLRLLTSIGPSIATRLVAAIDHTAPVGRQALRTGRLLVSTDASMTTKGAGMMSIRLVDAWKMQPDPSALPGGQVLQNLMNGLQSWALAFALIGLVIGAAAWAIGSHGQNYQQSFVGRRAVLVSGFAALLIGAGPGIVSFFFNAGQGVH
jgi:hypothetical protein